jgi:hypothetical protein
MSKILYEKHTEEPGYKPVTLTVTEDRGEVVIRKITWGPRGGKYFENYLRLNHNEWRAIVRLSPNFEIVD